MFDKTHSGTGTGKSKLFQEKNVMPVIQKRLAGILSQHIYFLNVTSQDDNGPVHLISKCYF